MSDDAQQTAAVAARAVRGLNREARKIEAVWIRLDRRIRELERALQASNPDEMPGPGDEDERSPGGRDE